MLIAIRSVGLQRGLFRRWVQGFVGVLLFGVSAASGQTAARPATYANPIDLPYRFRLEAPSRREAADPTMVVFHKEYWLFASKSGGYWRSKDLQHWTLVVPTGLPLEDYAPTAVVMNDRMYFTAYNSKAIYSTADPGKGVWTKDADIDAYADPDLFLDDDGKLYMYSGCSSKTPLRVTELDPRHGFAVARSEEIPASRDQAHRGFEVAGENNDAPQQGVWIEGSWMVKHGGRYYLQYAAAQTQLATYGDGVLVGDSAFGPFEEAPYSPVSFKPGGFITAAGHGSTFMDLEGRWWHIASMRIAVRHSYERRLGLFPVRFAADGDMVQDNYLADYPHRLAGDRGLAGWMLLSRDRAATGSSSLPGHEPAKAVAEDIRNWWSAATGNAGEWLQVDLGQVATVQAVQIDFADQDSTALGRLQDTYRYRLEGSVDAKNWRILVDHSERGRDAPHDYEQLSDAAHVRYVRLTNVHTPAGAKFSVSGLRVFGTEGGVAPHAVGGLTVARDAADRRIVHVSWTAVADAEFYVVRYGIDPDKLFSSYQVERGSSVDVRSLNSDVAYYFAVDAVSATGIRAGNQVVSAK